MTSFYTGSNVQYIRVPAGIFYLNCGDTALNVLGLFLYFTSVSFNQKFSLRSFEHTPQWSEQEGWEGGAHAEIKKKRPVEMSSLSIRKISSREIV